MLAVCTVSGIVGPYSLDSRGQAVKADFFGMPEFFVNRVDCESAGTGNIRVYCSTIRGGELVPAFSFVMSIPEIFEAIVTVKQKASELWNEATLRVEMMN